MMPEPAQDDGGHRIGHGGLCAVCGDPFPCRSRRFYAMVGQRRRAQVEQETAAGRDAATPG